MQGQLVPLYKIKEVLENVDIFEAIRNGFLGYSSGEAVIPPVGELLFDDPPGDVHIKYGYLKNQPYYVIKIASGFYQNSKLGLPSSQGLNLLFKKNSGELLAILLDEGYLTDVRTAVAGALASKALARTNSSNIGIVGAGTQARLQLVFHSKLFDFKKVFIWNHNIDRVQEIVEQMKDKIEFYVCNDLEDLCRNSDIIVTTTPSKVPLIQDQWILDGTHITAVGSDTHEKIELDPIILQRADLVVVDSFSQCQTRGEVFQALRSGVLTPSEILELGQILGNSQLGRKNSKQITIADLTGVAVQDLMISQAVYDNI